MKKQHYSETYFLDGTKRKKGAARTRSHDGPHLFANSICFDREMIDGADTPRPAYVAYFTAAACSFNAFEWLSSAVMKAFTSPVDQCLCHRRPLVPSCPMKVAKLHQNEVGYAAVHNPSIPDSAKE